ncbi:hypothetical protein HLK56_32645 [Streptomyces sp. G9]|uniref:hypothetical protein n=1 Tax=Streptomyces sp. G9 TaxID=1684483 RepID=UPI003D76433A
MRWAGTARFGGARQPAASLGHHHVDGRTAPERLAAVTATVAVRRLGFFVWVTPFFFADSRAAMKATST